MHHAPSGPSLPARVAAVVRRTRLVPLTVAGLVIVAMGLSEPPPAGSGRPGTAALTSPSQQGRVLVPATGDGWTQDGLPAPSATGGAPHAAAPVPTSPSAPRTSAAPPSSSPAPTPAPAPRATAESEPSTSAATSPSSRPSVSSTPSTSAAPSSAPSPSTPVAPAVVPDGAAVVLASVDAARADLGCAPLAVDPGLAAAAATHSAAMSDADALTAPSPEGLAMALTATGADADAIAADWLDGEGAALLGCDLTSAGAAVVDGWWTLLAT